MHQPWLAALQKAEADKEALAEQLANATSNVDPDDGQAGEVDEVLTGTGKKKKSVIPRPTGNFNIRDAMGLSGSEKRRIKYGSILVCFLPFSWTIFECLLL